MGIILDTFKKFENKNTLILQRKFNLILLLESDDNNPLKIR